MPHDEDFLSLYTTSVQEAAFAIYVLLEFLRGLDPCELVSVFRFSTDSIDLIVQKWEQMDPRDPRRELRIVEHPLMQQELNRQARDFIDARKLEVGDELTIRNFGQRSCSEHHLTLVQ